MGGLPSVVFGIIVGGAILLGTLQYFSNALLRSDANSSQQLVGMVAADVIEAYRRASSYGANTDLVPLIDGRGAIPAQYVRTEGSTVAAISPFGGPLTIVGNGGNFTITFSELDDDECRNMAERDVGDGLVTSVQLNSGAASAPPLDPTVIHSGCSGGSGSNSIRWTFD